MKKFYTTLFLVIASTQICFTDQWIRTYYSGPTSDLTWGESDYLYDGMFFYETTASVYVNYSAYLYAYCDSYEWLIQRDYPAIGASLSARNWLEIYEWSGNNPPTQPWIWKVSAYHYLFAKAANDLIFDDDAFARVQINSKVKVANSNEDTLYEQAYVKIEHGDGGIYISYPPGVTYNPSSSEEEFSIGITGIQQVTSTTTTGGPFDRNCIINYAEAVTDIAHRAGWDPYPSARASININFGL